MTANDQPAVERDPAWRRIYELEADLAALRQQIEALDSQLMGAAFRIKALESEVEQYEAQVEALTRERDELGRELTTLTTHHEKLQRWLNETQEALGQSEIGQVAAIRAQLTAAKTQVEALRVERDELDHFARKFRKA